MQALDDRILKFLLFLGGVCVVESSNEFAIGCLVGEVIVKKSSFGMTDVQISSVFSQPTAISMGLCGISRGLRGKACHHTVLGVPQTNLAIAPSFASRSTLLFFLGVRCFDLSLNLRMAGLDEGGPTCHVG